MKNDGGQKGKNGSGAPTDRDAQKHGFKKCIVFRQAFQHLRISRNVDQNRQGIFRNRLHGSEIMVPKKFISKTSPIEKISRVTNKRTA